MTAPAPDPTPPGDRGPSLRSLREQRRLAEKQLELARFQQAVRLTEDLGWNGGADYSSFGGSDSFYRARADGAWLPVPPSVPSDRRHGQQWPLVRTETELDRARQQSRLLVGVNSFAQGLLRNRRNYTVGKGFSYKVQAKGTRSGEKPTEGVKRVVELTQAVVDRFLERNRWNASIGGHLSLIIAATREQEVYCRVCRDGEAFLRFYFEDDGSTMVRAAEPECVRQSADTPEADGWSFGIQHQMEPFEDVESPEEYHLVWQDPATAGLHQDAGGIGEKVEAKYILHLKGPDTDAALARGLPDFIYDVAKALERAAQLQRNISVGDAARAATAELWKFTGYTQAQVSAWAGGNTDAARSYTDPMTGQQVNVDTRRPGAVRAIPAGMDLAQLPTDNSTPAYLQGLAGDLRQAAAAFASPEYWLGDASNGNYSSLETATAPPVKNGESEQEYYRVAFAAVVWRAIRWAVECGKLPPDALTVADLQVEAPAVLHRDKLQKSQADQIDIQCGKKSPQTAAMEDGLDPETELVNLEEFKDRTGGGSPLGLDDDGPGPDGQDDGAKPPPKPGLAGAVAGSHVSEAASVIDAVARLLEARGGALTEAAGKGGQFKKGGGRVDAAARHKEAKAAHRDAEKGHRSAERVKKHHVDAAAKALADLKAARAKAATSRRAAARKGATPAQKRQAERDAKKADRLAVLEKEARVLRTHANRLHGRSATQLKRAGAKVERTGAALAAAGGKPARKPEAKTTEKPAAPAVPVGAQRLMALAVEKIGADPPRVMQIAARLAAMDGQKEPGVAHVAEALQFWSHVVHKGEDAGSLYQPGTPATDRIKAVGDLLPAKKPAPPPKPARKAPAAKTPEKPIAPAAKPKAAPPPFSDDEKNALKDYSRGAAFRLNAATYEGLPPPTTALKKTDEHLQAAFAKSPTLASPVTVHRGLSMSPDRAAALAETLKAHLDSGEPWTHKGYVSATHKAEDTADMPVSMSIKTRNGIDMAGIGHNPDEAEFLMNKGSRFKVKAVSEKPGGGYHVELEEAGPAKPEPKPARKAPAAKAAPTAPAAASAKPPHEHVADAVRKHGGPHNLAHIADVRDHLAKAGVTDRAAQDAAIQQARRQGLVSGSGHEGRHGITDRERAAQLHQDGENPIGHLSLRGV